jgi:RimJ/RimL family protein N-acetyltransferase
MNLLAIDSDGTVSGSIGPIPDVGRSAIDSTVQLYSKVGWIRPWIGYLGFEDGVCVGTCAFTGPPKSNLVEIAYFTFPGYEGRGFATRMAASLVALARECAPEISVTAHTLAEENASTRILRKVGFVFVEPMVHDEDGQIWVWRYQGAGDKRKPEA